MEKFDRSYLEMAEVWAQNSYCKRRKVGALLVKDRTIISDGYNGTPSGFENICEDENGVTKPYVLHAEANAITKVAKSGNSSAGATLFVTAQTHHPGRHQACGVPGCLPPHGRHRPPGPCRH